MKELGFLLHAAGSWQKKFGYRAADLSHTVVFVCARETSCGSRWWGFCRPVLITMLQYSSRLIPRITNTAIHKIIILWIIILWIINKSVL